MKPTQTPAANTQALPNGDRGRVIGLAVITLAVAFATVWMYVHGRAAIAAPNRPAAPQVQSANDARFRSDATQLPNDSQLGFVEVPGGTFTMGSDPALDPTAYDNERWSSAERQGHVDLPTFYISRYEVTVGQFGAFVTATQRAVDTQTLRSPSNHPVTNVTWTDAIAYARWLETQLASSQETPAPIAALLKDGWHLALPSEAQWEKAARGLDGRIYPWGNEPDPSQANFGRSGTAPVGAAACAQCSFGLADMSGNVWELTRSPFQPYPWSASDEAQDTNADALFVMRGGAFNDPPQNVRTAIRGGIDPGARRPFIGFRLVLEKP